MKKTADWVEILHNHTYGHASGGDKNFPLGYLSKITQNYSKKHSVSHTRVMQSPIGLIFCRNMLMNSLQGLLKDSLAEVIFH